MYHAYPTYSVIFISNKWRWLHAIKSGTNYVSATYCIISCY